MKKNKNNEFSQYEDLFKKLNITPHNIELYDLAFTHKSYNFDAKTTHQDYERLEFLGDCFLNFVVGDLCYQLHPEFSQGEMTKLRSNLVQSFSLKSLGENYHFERYIKIGKSLQNTNVSTLPHLFEDVFEALIGAMYYDQGYKITYGLIKKIFYADIMNFKLEKMHDYKSKLQEYVQSESKTAVTYKVISEKGPSNNREFEVVVMLNEIILGHGKGKSKKEAEQEAAKDALSKKAE